MAVFDVTQHSTQHIAATSSPEGMQFMQLIDPNFARNIDCRFSCINCIRPLWSRIIAICSSNHSASSQSCARLRGHSGTELRRLENRNEPERITGNLTLSPT